jgi:hypothetical protein
MRQLLKQTKACVCLELQECKLVVDHLHKRPPASPPGRWSARSRSLRGRDFT